jgi:2-methylisocitrate lyase-like PEP mutase family enzyme
MTQQERHERFRALHQGPGLLVMPNAWDGMSALLLREAGFQALGSSSIALAFALGRPDGAHAVSREAAVAHAALLSQVSGLPVNGDLEDGFGPDPEDCALTVDAAVAAGLAGLGIEDTSADPSQPILDFDLAVARVRRAAEAARGRIVLTARTDNYLKPGPYDLDDTVRRLCAFAEAGADVLFAPGLPDREAIRRVVQAVAPRPVNVVVGPATGPVTVAELQALGVRRLSLGGALYRHSLAALRQSAQALAAGGVAAAIAGAIPSANLAALLPPTR